MHRDKAQDLKAETERGGVHRGMVPADDACAFQFAQTPLAAGHAQAHTVGELSEGLPAISLQLSKNFAICRIHIHEVCQ